MIRILNGNVRDFAEYIKRGSKRMYLWGTGVMLRICIEQLLLSEQLTEYVACVTDADPNKTGRPIFIGTNRHTILSTEEFIEALKKDKNAVIVITNTYFFSIVAQLDEISQLDKTECVIAPLMYIEEPKGQSVSFSQGEQRIPKIIHYCWFGGKPIPEKNRQCISSWKEKCPDYEIKLWNESNISLELSPWVKKYAEQGRWAFVSDYIRAYLLYEYGGLYFDADVELLKSFDGLLGLEAFGGYEKWPVLNTGGGCGSVKGFRLWKEIMELKDSSVFAADPTTPQASGYYDTLPLIRKGLKPDGTMQTVSGFTILPSDFFQPFDYVSKTDRRTQNTHSVHYFNWSWASGMMRDGSSASQSEYELLLQRAQPFS
ncbi:MAG: glycosyltransferase family 32 protein [Oscillospiraceae bacterium]